MKKITLLAVTFVALLASRVDAVNLLTGGTFEVAGGEVPFWDLDEYYTNSPDAINTATVNSAFLDKIQSPTKSLWFRAFAGSTPTGDPNKWLTNAVLSQTVAATAGVTYNFTGYSQFEANYSGGVDTLNASSPLGAVPSPTFTEMMIEYLDGSSNPIGAPFTIDVKADRIAQIGFPLANDNNYYQHLVSGLAPAGTMQARVTMGAYDMVRNGTGAAAGTGPQSAFVDTFSFTTTGAPATELLLNAGLDGDAPNPLDGWIVTNNDPGNPTNMEVIRANGEGFANNTPGGATGIWLSSFFGETGTEVDGTISQINPAVVGEEYSFSAWSRFEANYTAASTYITLDFLDGANMPIGSPNTLDVGTAGQMNDGVWRQFSVNGIAPVGAVSVRVLAGMENGIGTSGSQSAFFDDFVLELVDTGTPGDFDGDGDVDGRDFLSWQRGVSPTPFSPADLATWQGAYNGGALAAVNAVPEPASVALIGLGLAALGLCRAKRVS